MLGSDVEISQDKLRVRADGRDFEVVRHVEHLAVSVPCSQRGKKVPDLLRCIRALLQSEPVSSVHRLINSVKCAKCALLCLVPLSIAGFRRSGHVARLVLDAGHCTLHVRVYRAQFLTARSADGWFLIGRR